MPNCGLKKYRNTVHLWRKPILGTIDVSSKSRLLIRKLMCVFSFNAMAYLHDMNEMRAMYDLHDMNAYMH